MTDAQLKKAVADALSRAINLPGFAGDIVGDGRGDIKAVTITHPTSLVSHVRVVTQNAGVHYYSVTLRENY